MFSSKVWRWSSSFISAKWNTYYIIKNTKNRAGYLPRKPETQLQLWPWFYDCVLSIITFLSHPVSLPLSHSLTKSAHERFSTPLPSDLNSLKLHDIFQMSFSIFFSCPFWETGFVSASSEHWKHHNKVRRLQSDLTFSSLQCSLQQNGLCPQLLEMTVSCFKCSGWRACTFSLDLFIWKFRMCE